METPNQPLPAADPADSRAAASEAVITSEQTPAAAPAKPGMSRRATMLILLIAISFVVMPFLFWRASWFGAPMSAADITEALAPGAEARKTQHALARLATLMDAHSPAPRQWYPAIAAEGKHPDPQIRLTAAWVMGLDNTSQEFHQTLSSMLADPDAMVRINAALALVRFADPAGRPQLLALLQPYTIAAPAAGFTTATLRPRLKEHEAVRAGTLVARMDSPEGVIEVRSPVPGVFERWLQPAGAPIVPQQPICLLSPDPSSAWEALRGLYLIGRPEDATVIASFLRTTPDLPASVAEQARLTLQTLQSRK
ncbi:MAG TPA: HEAT repeat domain-containing protein [Candidatus Acidoferrales bacterium]|nr:HEAT repeat domain-containing protein [Candidatus Acidoferrales bacterium]